MNETKYVSFTAEHPKVRCTQRDDLHRQTAIRDSAEKRPENLGLRRNSNLGLPETGWALLPTDLRSKEFSF